LARRGPARTPHTDQMTLDDWERILRASTEPPTMPCPTRESVDPSSSIEAPANDRNGGAEAASHRGPRHHPSAQELLETTGALLTRTHLRELGLERRAIDAVFRKLPVVSLPGYSRPMIRVEEYLELISDYTYRDDRVRPSHG
jgi:hypothetical protein